MSTNKNVYIVTIIQLKQEIGLHKLFSFMITQNFSVSKEGPVGTITETSHQRDFNPSPRVSSSSLIIFPGSSSLNS